MDTSTRPVSAPLPDERLDTINENLTLLQKKDGLTFGTDAYLLAAFLHTGSKTKAAELGAGTGVISLLALTRQKMAHTTLYEIQPDFADLCRRNGERNGLSDRMTVVCGDVRDMRGDQSLDLVYANPPYMKGDCGKENENSTMNIARREVFGTIGDFCGAAGRLLRHGGTFAVVYRPDRFCDLVCAMNQYQLAVKRVVFVYPTAQDRPCLVLVEAKKGAASGMVISPPLLIYQDAEKKTYTPEMERIYGECGMTFLFPGNGR